MTKPTLRHAALTDIDNIQALEQSCFTTDLMSRNSIRHFIKTPTAAMLVATTQTTIIGNILILFRQHSHTARIYSLAVHTDYRNQGIAAKLHAAAEKIIREHNCNAVVLEVHPNNKPAIHFYEKNGYEIFGKYQNFYECGSDALRMKKIL